MTAPQSRNAKPDPAPSSPRLNRADWLDFARNALVGGGIDEVNVDRLAKRANITRGSFYWHFRNRQDLLMALLADWERHNLAEIATIRERWAVAGPDFTDIIVAWLAEQRDQLRFDHAIRGWARANPTVAEVVHRADDAWIELMRDLFLHSGCATDEALVRARIAHFHQVGYHALGLDETAEERLRLVPLFYEVLSGQPAPPRLFAMIEGARPPAWTKADLLPPPTDKVAPVNDG